MLIEDLDEIHQHFLFFKPWILLQNGPAEFKIFLHRKYLLPGIPY